MAANRPVLIGAGAVAAGLLVAAALLVVLSGNDEESTATDAGTSSTVAAIVDPGAPEPAGQVTPQAAVDVEGSTDPTAPTAADTGAAIGAPADGGSNPGTDPAADAATGATTASTAGASGAAPAGFTSGIATYYDATGAGACMFDPSPGDLRVAAMNAPQYGTADLCGAWVEVNGPQGSITVRIVDLCPECESGHLDLSQEAFAAIGNPVDGIIAIDWRIVEAGVSGPIAFRFKEGSSQYWTAVQVRNHRHPVANLEYQLPDGSWQAVARKEYNYFVEPAGMGPGPYTFRVTDVYGNVVVESGINLAVAGVVSGASQFP